MTIGSEGNVYSPVGVKLPDSTQVPPMLGVQGEALNSDIHGKHFTTAYRKNLFAFNVTAVTVPVIAASLVSVFSLWNPPNSGVIGELVDTEVGQVLAATVMDTVGWYFTSGPKALAGTFTTPSVANTNHFAGRIGDIPNNQIVPYTAYTHSGTPVRFDLVAIFGGSTDLSMAMPSKFYDGRVLIPPGVVISIAMSTTVGTASGLDLSVRWAEWPF